MSSEIISLHIGQAGVQIADSLWELYGAEHSVSMDGTPSDNNNNTTNNSDVQTLFAESQSGKKYTPRAFLIDIDPDAIRKITSSSLSAYQKAATKSAPKGYLFNPHNLLIPKTSGFNDCSDNYASGYYLQKEFLSDIVESVQKELERCGHCQGFMLYHSVSGGTGSGLTTALMEKLKSEFGSHLPLVNICVGPSANNWNGVMQGYNSSHAFFKMFREKQSLSDLVVVTDNEGMYPVASQYFKLMGGESEEKAVAEPSFMDCNRLISLIASDMTASIRFAGGIGGGASQSLHELCQVATSGGGWSFPPLVTASIAAVHNDDFKDETNKTISGKNISDLLMKKLLLVDPITTSLCLSQPQEEMITKIGNCDPRAKKVLFQTAPVHLNTNLFFRCGGGGGENNEGDASSLCFHLSDVAQAVRSARSQPSPSWKFSEDTSKGWGKHSCGLMLNHVAPVVTVPEWVVESASREGPSPTSTSSVLARATLLTQTNALTKWWTAHQWQTKALWAKRAFVHWTVGEGEEEEVQSECIHDNWFENFSE